MRVSSLFLTALAVGLPVACTCGSTNLRTAESVLASPPLVDFGDVPVGVRATADVRLSVSGPGEVNLITTSVTGSSVFNAAQPSDAPVTNSAAQTIHVTFQPTDEGAVAAVLLVSNDSLSTSDLNIQLRGRGVAQPSCDDNDSCTTDSFDASANICRHVAVPGSPCDGTQIGPGGGFVSNCDGYSGSPSCDIIQVPASANADQATATCPSPYVLIGCGFLCDGGAASGGTEMVNETTCRASCQSASTASATAFCYRGDPSYVARVVLTDVPRDTDATCPDSHPQVLGCTSRCVNDSTANNPGGATLANDGRACRARCDIPGDISPQLVVYCGNYPKAYSQVVINGEPSGSAVTCPEHTTLAGGLGMCVNGHTGGFIATDSRQYVGYCQQDAGIDQLAAFCLAD